MATWESLRGYVISNYTIARDDADAIGLRFRTEGDRSQVIMVRKADLGGFEWAQIVTPVAQADQVDARDALVRSGNMVVGGLAIEGDLLVFRHSIPLKDLDVDEFEIPLGVAVNFGDELEKALTGGGDEF
jgi:hypothetical protein